MRDFSTPKGKKNALTLLQAVDSTHGTVAPREEIPSPKISIIWPADVNQKCSFFKQFFDILAWPAVSNGFPPNP